MHFIVAIALASAPVGLLIGLTGTGGGSLLTPMLTLFFHVKTSSAISGDLIASIFMRPLGVVVHMKRQTVNYALVGLLSLGSVPMAFVGAALMHRMSRSATFGSDSTVLLGALLVAGALALFKRNLDDRRRSLYWASSGYLEPRDLSMRQAFTLRPLPTVATGMFVGLGVAMTSVGAGALTMVLLLALYPALSTRELVGTDLAQAVPLTIAAAIGSILFWHVDPSLTGSILLGGVPGVGLGAAVSSRTSTRAIQPLVVVAILFAGLKSLGLNGVPLAALVVFAGIALLVLALRYPGPGSNWKIVVRGTQDQIVLD